MTDTSAVPNPGSDEAVARGCTCPVMDNAHGRGVPRNGGTVFWMSGDCPVHNPKPQIEEDKTDDR